ncbi:YaiI/YqxD family protein [Alteromonas sp. 5E99-2]|uniref:YaiI/YqxD family protein n=1 Tax=Alteromonas sp. 5E99-2 TaxID=2817683 RepID=UPI001A9A215D|nr:YaiI/YqxD family protein [Alteromonas sp. 5E99-2]MBO1255920.1 YaiI/YqxD family protein [Alteromonas sp. 5E99-2]
MTERTMWVDADACPNVIKDVLFKASTRTKIPLTLIANQYLRTPSIRWITAVQVDQGFDEADNELVRRANAGDIVITSDIPLADELIDKGVRVLTPRGEVLEKENIKSRLNIRDFMDTMRSSGVQTGGPPPMSTSEKQAFSNALDKWIHS